MIYRVDVHPRIPTDHGLGRQVAAGGIDAGPIVAGRVYLIDADDPRDAFESTALKLLADPIADNATVSLDAVPTSAGSVIEVHFKPGVMDPVATSAEAALRDLGLSVRQVRTGRSYAFDRKHDRATLDAIARRYLANAVVETVHYERHVPTSFATPHVALFEVRRVAIRDLTDEQLTRLSRDGHLFLNLVEMRAVQQHYRDRGREPTDVELETLAQTWSEHCVHKTLKSAVEVVDQSGQVVRKYKNLIKETIFRATQDLIRGTGLRHVRTDDVHVPEARATSEFCLSVFKDNAGVVAFDDEDAVCFKVETHNRPSAIEPYGGAATGIGGCIRDVLGTGLGARPIANTNVFCVADPSGRWAVGSGQAQAISSSLPTAHRTLPTNAIHPRRVLQQVVAGVRDYGNRMGIPTVNGAVYFDDNYVGNPLVFAGCVGILPRAMIEKRVSAGDAIVVMGGRTGRDGIHGATFSSAEVTSTHADEFSHAVQIGNAITQKRLMDVLLVARDRGLYSAVTDCGAGGLSSAVGEMGGEVGARVELDRVPLKYAGLRYDEVWISEAQERMVLSVPPGNVEALLQLARDENVEATAIGRFGTDDAELILTFNGTEVGRMSMAFLHDGIPMPTRRALVHDRGAGLRHVQTDSVSHVPEARATAEMLLRALAHPNVASKHWVIRQYDHEVQGGTVVKPLVGPRQVGPSDAAVIRPKPTSPKGVVLACGMVPSIADPYAMALASIDEAIRNAVCVGARLDQLAILDNFCWPGVHDEASMGTLVRACEACRDAALGYRVPFISGKDSLHNQFTDAASGRVIRIPNTLLISAIGVIDDVSRCVTSDLKRAGNTVCVFAVDPELDTDDADGIARRRELHEWVSACGNHWPVARHDVSDGGLLVAVAEMCIGSGLGLAGPIVFRDRKGRPVRLPGHDGRSPFDVFGAFNERVTGYVVECKAGVIPPLCRPPDCVVELEVGTVTAEPRLKIDGVVDVSVDDLTRAWRGTLDW